MTRLAMGDDMDAESLVDEFAERLGGHLAEQGFETDEWTFRRYSEHRDTLILAFQKSKLWNDEEAHFFINVYLSLNPVWEHERVADGLPEDEPPRAMTGLMLTRIEPPSPYEDSWRIVNEATLADVLDKVLQQIGEVLPHYTGLLDRTELFARLDELFGAVRAWRLRSWLLAESGPSAELEQLLSEQQDEHPTDRGAAELIRDYAATKAPRS
jgi:hypothetical protein